MIRQPVLPRQLGLGVGLERGGGLHADGEARARGVGVERSLQLGSSITCQALGPAGTQAGVAAAGLAIDGLAAGIGARSSGAGRSTCG